MDFLLTGTHTARSKLENVVSFVLKEATKTIGLNRFFSDYFICDGKIMYELDCGHYRSTKTLRQATPLDQLVFGIYCALSSSKIPKKYVEFPVHITGELGGSLSSKPTEDTLVICIRAVAELFTTLEVEYTMYDLSLACGVEQPTANT